MAITLKAARVNAGLTQEQAAEKIGVSPGMIVKWEKGQAAPSCKRVTKILETYGVKYEDVIFASSS